MKTVLLKSLANIFYGYTFRTAIDDDPMGNYLVIQAKNIKRRFISPERDLDKTRLKLSTNVAILKPGDVVLSCRGSFRVAVFTSQQPCIASSSVLIIRPKSPDVIAKFIALFLNSSIGQSYLTRFSTGVTIQSINISELSTIPIPVPSLETQKLMVGLLENVESQKRLLQKQQTIISNIYEGALIHQLIAH